MRTALQQLEAAYADQQRPKARPASEYHEDMGPVLWWRFPIQEPPYVGGPNDLGFAVDVNVNGDSHRYWVGGWPGYHTHFTPIQTPALSTQKTGAND